MLVHCLYVPMFPRKYFFSTRKLKESCLCKGRFQYMCILLRFFSWGRSLKIHIEIKRALFMFFCDMCIYLCFYLPCTSCGCVLIPSFFYKYRLFLCYKVIGIISVHTSLRLISALGSEFVNTYPHFF